MNQSYKDTSVLLDEMDLLPKFPQLMYGPWLVKPGLKQF